MAKKTSIDLFSEITKELTSGDLKPIYVLCGEEEFFHDRLLDKFRALIPEHARDFNMDLIYGRESTVDRVLNIARQFPMGADRRMVIVRDFLALAEKSKAPGGEGEQSASMNELVPYLENPNPGTLLLLIDTKKPNARTKVGKALKKGKMVGYFEFKEVPDYKLADWVQHWSRLHHNKTIEPRAAALLAHFVGSNLNLLSTEIDKVCTFQDSSQSIDEAAIKKVIGVYREYTVFELKDAVVARDKEKALGIAEQILQQTDSATGEVIKTVGFFYSLFSNIWQIRRLALKQNKAAIQKAMGIGNSWYFNKLWDDAAQFSLSEIPLIFEALLDADRAAKGFGKMEPAGIFLLMVERIIRC